MKNFFAFEGKYYQFMNKLGNLMGISMMFVLTSIPIITIVPSLSALYYTTVKTQRTGNGYPVQEYKAAFKRELKQGMIFNLCFIISAIVLVLDIWYVTQSETLFAAISFAVLVLLFFIWIALFIYLPVLLSRFNLSSFALFKMSLMMLFRHLPYTLLFIIIYLLAVLILYLMPIPFLIILPAVLMFGISFLMERILKKYLASEVLNEGQSWYTML
ncbi:YesL family protein [Fundicoccus sp. Sow4_H7]|uniref:YesL family protein n=1 Tax=Fundicoccus sp. Sow4_H7 TaxID=3438784 RepID=UPI003F8FB1F0